MKKIFNFLLILLVILIPAGIFANSDNERLNINISEDINHMSLEEIDTILDKYTEVYIDGTIYFDIDLAREYNLPEYIYEIGDVINQISSSPNLIRNTRISLPVYGKYCGPGRSGPGKPVDDLDRYCQTHDRCYEYYGYFNCDCNFMLISNIRNNYEHLGAAQKVVASAIKKYFEIQMNWNDC